MYFGHPSHYYVLKYIRKELIKNNHQVFVFIKTKDILEQILKEDGIEYNNIFPDTKKNSKISLIKSVLIKNFRFYKKLRKIRPDIVLGSASDITPSAFLLRIPIFIFNDDDSFIVPKSAFFGWPTATKLLTPISCDMGKWEKKTIKYNAYQKTAYLHPNQFKPDSSVITKYGLQNKTYFIIRSVSLTAHHDDNIEGLSNDLVVEIIDVLKTRGEVIISSERELSNELEPYRKNIKVTDMHSLLYYSALLIADSQSMCHEAALLGVPSVRYNDFVGRIGVLNDIEDKGLAIGVNPPDKNRLIEQIKKIVEDPNIKKELRNKSQKVVASQIDLTGFSVWFVENYPQSAKVMKENPSYQEQFK